MTYTNKQIDNNYNMRFYIYLLLLLLFSCVEKQKFDETIEESDAFHDFKDNYLNEILSYDSRRSLSMGYLEYNSKIDVVDSLGIKKKVDWYKTQDSLINTINYSYLKDLEKLEYGLIKNDIEKQIWIFTEYKRHEWDPTIYDLYNNLFQGIKTDLPFPKKLNDVNEKLKQIPKFYEQASTMIDVPSEILLNSAIASLPSSLIKIQAILSDSIKNNKLADKAITNELNKNFTLAQQSLLEFNEVLKEKRKKKNYKQSSIGKENYNELFQLTFLTEKTATRFYEQAKLAEQAVNKRISALIPTLWAKYFPNEEIPQNEFEAIGKLKKEIYSHTIEKEAFENFNEEMLQYLENFVTTKKIAKVPDRFSINIEYTPNYIYNQKFGTLYTETKSDVIDYLLIDINKLNAEESENLLKRYSKYYGLIHIIHETIPGHFLQYAYQAENKSKIKNYFKIQSTYEGWSSYVEKMMVDKGVGHKVGAIELEFYYCFRLKRQILYSILDYEIHSNNWTFNDLLTYGEKNNISVGFSKIIWELSISKPLNATNYYFGLYEIENLRNEIEVIEGEFFEIEEFHEQFLSYGNIHINLIRELLLTKYKESIIIKNNK